MPSWKQWYRSIGFAGSSVLEAMMVGFPLGLVYANAVEWVVHKYVLHQLGKKKGSMWAFHWREHHRNARRNNMFDPGYTRPIWDWNARGKEVAGIGALMALHLPLWPVAPAFTSAVWLSAVNYLRRHRKSHVEPDWGRRHMPWHYEHHMGRNQDSNWCVSYPWTDWILGTRVQFDVPCETSWRVSFSGSPSNDLSPGGVAAE